MSFIAELKQAFYDLPLVNKPHRDSIAHFCEHDGIRIEFHRARTTWHAVTPSSVKPWWIILEPLRRSVRHKQQGSAERVIAHEPVA